MQEKIKILEREAAKGREAVVPPQRTKTSSQLPANGKKGTKKGGKKEAGCCGKSNCSLM